MNGRIFDPYTGRFLSADAKIQSPNELQSYNRYSYCWNSPMLCTDPSGYSFLGEMFSGLTDTWHDLWHDDVIRMAMGVAAVWVIGPGGLYGSGGFFGAGYGLASATAAGFVGGYISSQGNLQAGLIGAATGAAFFGIGEQFSALAQENSGSLLEQIKSGPNGFGPGMNLVGSTGLTSGQLAAKVVEHGLVGGLGSVAGGGKFGPGALAGGFGEVASLGLGQSGIQNPAAQFTVTTIVGGTASVIGGGKFANGALTAAFGYLFNQLPHISRVEILVSDSRLTSGCDSCFGHVAIRVDDEVYSRAHNQVAFGDFEVYMAHQQNMRGSIGFELSLNADQVTIIKNYMENLKVNNAPYDLLNNSCASTVADALAQIHIQVRGPWMPLGGIEPTDIAHNIVKTGTVIQQNYYPKLGDLVSPLLLQKKFGQ